jgi:hypothetical protein
MINKNWHGHLKLFVATLIVGLSFSSANAVEKDLPSCKNLMAKLTYAKNPVAALRDNFPALISRIKPAYKNDKFDVRILSSKVSDNSFSPQQLKERTIQEVGSIQNSFLNLGFTFRSYLQVLIEAQPKVIGSLGVSENGKIGWKEEVSTPWVGNAREFIGIPNFLGERELFVGKTDKSGFDDMPRFLVLPAVTKSYHSLQNTFVVAHEIAHETENPSSHRSLIWREARADFLAFVATGETDVLFSEGVDLELVKSDGTIYKQRVTKVRSLNSPTVAKVADLMPKLGAYHHNSQIISSALFEISNQLGQARAISFVRWMDSLGVADIVPDLEPAPKNDKEDFKPKANIEYIDESNFDSVKNAITGNLARIGDLFRKWVITNNLTAREKSLLQSILHQRGI